MLKALTSPGMAGVIFLACMLIAYVGGPLVMYRFTGNPYAVDLAKVTLVGCAAFTAGWFIRIRARMYVLSVSCETLSLAVWLPFLAFACLVWLTAEKIPLVAALQGAPADQVAEWRERFLKAREGWQASFVYVNTFLTWALVPYTLALMFHLRSRLRWWCFVFFLVFCVSFMEKAFFLRAIIPMLFLAAQGRLRLPFRPGLLLALSFGLLLGVSLAAGMGDAGKAPGADYLSSGYNPTGGLDFLVWRSLVIPVITAMDWLRIFHENFGGRFFGGGTSTLLAPLFGVPHVEFERAVYAAQWGQNATGTGNANAVFLLEAFVNWGYTGVLAAGCAVGMLFRLIRDSTDCCFQSLWLLLLFALFVAGLIGILVSNGYLVLLALVFFVRVRFPQGRPARVQGCG